MLSGAVFKIRNKRRQNRIDAWLQGFTCFILSKRVVSFKEYSGVMGEAGNVTETTKKELTAEVKRLIFRKGKDKFLRNRSERFGNNGTPCGIFDQGSLWSSSENIIKKHELTYFWVRNGSVRSIFL